MRIQESILPPMLARNQYSDAQSHRVSVGEMMPADNTADIDTGQGGTRVSRRLSQRAMEKARGS